ncbi:mediator complex subunit MED7 KNAG_0A01270 [Huiozyma naganishii CBS 8797]|uniref:Mediator of RNA polymerase II transcription subunit 7 n=1 Tax=Huiozyma naganishii (strain ATCC MYA-139 / BCRC 22969 / CBS 8797 / KCTC 17520 / NBRC 10181 / NCYC 3082 / Yp74L-3) TaxID=1071383 RepID=J7S362_HUIN7|nr:hypothetical protein KNAG_0A01270 [Kazachstania naganishii CBS 8797]CCK67816.1 hypothetical protein KNAG_0A01270 [Kazachstania naganishii CBS 8797]
MAEEPASNDISSLYPPPPPYIKFFTKENLDRLPSYLEKKRSQEQGGYGNDAEHVTSELDFLIPPPMPADDQYRAFGSTWQVKDKLPDLEAMGMTQLYQKTQPGQGPSPEGEATNYQYKIKELKRLLQSLLLNYLELVGILSINPELYEPKVENIRTVLVNIHHLLNEYRPHQSRESLIMLLEEQLEYKKGEIKTVEATCQQVRQKLAEIEKSLT